jgi:hypothetical protein
LRLSGFSGFTGFVVAGDAGKVEAELDASALLLVSFALERGVVAYDDDPKKSRIPIVYDVTVVV